MFENQRQQKKNTSPVLRTIKITWEKLLVIELQNSQLLCFSQFLQPLFFLSRGNSDFFFICEVRTVSCAKMVVGQDEDTGPCAQVTTSRHLNTNQGVYDTNMAGTTIRSSWFLQPNHVLGAPRHGELTGSRTSTWVSKSAATRFSSSSFICSASERASFGDRQVQVIAQRSVQIIGGDGFPRNRAVTSLSWQTLFILAQALPALEGAKQVQNKTCVVPGLSYLALVELKSQLIERN